MPALCWTAVVCGLCLVITLPPAVVSLPRLSARRLGRIPVPFRDVSQRLCKSYMKKCIPWKTSCCGAMTCMNLAKGYCLYPLELCRCQKVEGASMF